VCESEKGEFVWERDGVGLMKVCVCVRGGERGRGGRREYPSKM